MTQKLKNNARSLLVSSILAGDTSLVVESGKADLFPVADTGTDPVGTFGKDWFKAVLQDTAGNIEIIYVRTRPGGNATFSNVQRGMEGTTARDYAAGSVVGLRITSLDIELAISLATSAGATGQAIVAAASFAAVRTLLGATVKGTELFTAADAAAARSALGATAAGQAVMTAADYAAIRTLLGLVIGTDVQAYDAATAKLNVAQVYTKAQRGGVVDLTDGATITPNFADGNMFRVELAGNRILANPTNLVKGQSGSIDIHQDNTGSRTLTFGWGWQFAAGVAPALTTAARAKDKLTYQVDEYKTSNVTISIASPGVVTWAGHGLLAGTPIRLTTTGALPTGLATATTYYVIPVDANSFRLAATQSGTAINTTGSQSSTHTAEAISISAALMSAVR